MAETTKPALNLVGPQDGLVTLEDLAAMYKQLTGKDPTPEDLDAAKAVLDAPDEDE